MKRVLKNPLLPGFYPDPSVCRKGQDYYMVTSTFEYYPGVPIFHSRDFINWHQIGHVLDRPSQLNLDYINPSRGIYAASIFYHEKRDLFYMITTLVGNAPYWENQNFFVTAKDPAGPWSDPVVIPGAEGIDPSLVFDGDKTYYLGNLRPDPDAVDVKERHIWLQELDMDRGVLVGERHILLTDGAVHKAAAPEGPHIYHIGDWYYLLIAEGGTAHNHSCSIFRSKAVTGPYEINPRNPLITHRNLRTGYPIHSTGHGDLIQLHNGEWWVVLLASRPDGGDYRNLGRETFAAPVIWEEEWPVFSPETGRVEFEFPAPDLPEVRWQEEPACEQFEGDRLPYAWITVRTPRREFYSLEERPGYLRLYLGPEAITEASCCAFVGRRQQHLCFAVRTAMEFTPEKDGEESGIVLLMNHDYQIRMVYGRFDGVDKLRLIRRFGGLDEIIAEQPCEAGRLYLKASARYQDFNFYYANKAEDWKTLAEHVDGRLLSKEVAGGFTGTIIGMYGSANGQESGNFADFDWFEYQGADGEAH